MPKDPSSALPMLLQCRIDGGGVKASGSERPKQPPHVTVSFCENGMICSTISRSILEKHTTSLPSPP